MKWLQNNDIIGFTTQLIEVEQLDLWHTGRKEAIQKGTREMCMFCPEGEEVTDVGSTEGIVAN